MTTMDTDISDPDKNQALTIVIEKLTEIVDNINQDEASGGKNSGSSTPKAGAHGIDQSKENVDYNSVQLRPGVQVMEPVSYLQMSESQMLEDTAETVEISTEQGGSPNQVVINLPVVVGDMNITSSEGLLESLKQLDHGTETFARKDRDKTLIFKSKDIFKCSKCEYSSHNKHYLKQHVDLVHTAERPFKCPLCDYAGKRSHSLKEHLVVHSPYRPFMCPFCSASFRKKGHLTNHIKLHASEQAVACSICKHFIANRGELSRHLRQAHVGGDVFLCHSCDYATTDDSDIVMHMHTHGNPTVYSCSECKFIGVHEGVLKKHVQGSHGGEGSFTVSTSNNVIKSGPLIFLKCSECGFTTNKREAMKEHMYQNHMLSLDNQAVQNKEINLSQKPNSGLESKSPNPEGAIIANIDSESVQHTKMLSEEQPTSVQPEKIENMRVEYACSGCQFNSYNRQVMVDHIVENHQSKTQAAPSDDKSVVDSPTLQNSVLSQQVKEEMVDDKTSERSSYVCSVCKVTCHEAMAFITHMLLHAPKQPVSSNPSSLQITSKAEQESAGDSGEDTTKLGFMQDKAAGLYCCLICGYTCDHQRTIKAHIWKHSGHKDINYPTFQNGPLSMYEESSGEASTASLATTSQFDSNLPQKAEAISTSTKPSVIVSTSSSLQASQVDTKEPVGIKPVTMVTKNNISEVSHGEDNCVVPVNDDSKLSESESKRQQKGDLEINNSINKSEQSRKRKLPISVQSEMDMSMPKLRIVCSESSALEINKKVSSSASPVVVQSMPNLYVASESSLNKQETHGGSPRCSSPEQGTVGTVGASKRETDSNNLNTLEDDAKNTEIILEEVIESEDVVEVIVETTNNKNSGDQSIKEPVPKPVSLRDLLQKQKSVENDIISRENSATKARSVSTESDCSATIQNTEQGISSSLLAVIEQFRKDVSPGAGYDGIEDAQMETENYEKVRNFYRCCLCHYTSRFVAGIKSHMRTHKVRKPKECSLCDFVAVSNKHLQAHMLEHCPLNKEPTYECSVCSCLFFYKNQLRAHMRLHSSSSVTTKALNNTTSATQLKDEAVNGNTHHKKEPHRMDDVTRCYVCENCETTYSSIELLLKHKMKIVCWNKSSGSDVGSSDEKDCMKCNFCDFVGMSVRSLKSHMKRHWNDLRAKHSSDKASTDKISRSEGSKIQKHFVCERCTGVFDDIIDLLTHNSTTCSGTAQIPRCLECNFISPNPDLFKKHMNYHHNHGKIYKCEMCDFVSKSYSRMDNHVKKHIEPCDLHCTLCDFIATSVRSLKSHMKRHTNDQRFVRQPLEQYKCNMCGYICHHLPALKSHMWRHASETSYSYEKTNAVINAAIEDGTSGPEEASGPEKYTVEGDDDPMPEASQYSTISEESDAGDSIIAFRCCHCFFETCVKKELNEHMKQHMDIIQKTMEVNNDLFFSRTCERKISDGTEVVTSKS